MSCQIRKIDDSKSSWSFEKYASAERLYDQHMGKMSHSLGTSLQMLASDSTIHDTSLIHLDWQPSVRVVTIEAGLPVEGLLGQTIIFFEFSEVMVCMIKQVVPDEFDSKPTKIVSEVDTLIDALSHHPGHHSLILHCDTTLSVTLVFKSVRHWHSGKA
jgi:hypothetical protein